MKGFVQKMSRIKPNQKYIQTNMCLYVCFYCYYKHIIQSFFFGVRCSSIKRQHMRAESFTDLFSYGYVIISVLEAVCTQTPGSTVDVSLFSYSLVLHTFAYQWVVIFSPLWSKHTLNIRLKKHLTKIVKKKKTVKKKKISIQVSKGSTSLISIEAQLHYLNKDTHMPENRGESVHCVL